MNERWRVALAGLVAALAVPFLIIDSPAPAGGVITGEQQADDLVAPFEDVQEAASVDVLASGVPENAVEIIVTTAEVLPDVARLADHAGSWSVARRLAIQDGRVAATFTPPPSETNYSLLPVVKAAEIPEAPLAEEPPPTPAPEPDPVEAVNEPGEEPNGQEPPLDGEPEVPTEPGDPGEEPEAPAETEPEPDPVEPAPEPAPELAPEGPNAPAQVNGRVPPPSGGPTAAQWDAVRKCESTHNYRAISPSGLYRGAYQFSQQTWDWVSGIHWPHLVGVDPIDAEPAWQDVMAYTLYAMRGWDQWPICGKHLL